MANLYELSENYRNLQELLDNPDVPNDIIEKALDDIQGDITDKFENIAKLIKSLSVDAEGIKAEETRLGNRRKAIENRQASLKQYVETNLKALGKDKIKGKLFTLSIQKNSPSVNIKAIEDIPTYYFIPQDPKLDKKLLLEDLKHGQTIYGAEIIQTESLRIR